jgi:DNA-binding XRE family transcriptional regulator
LISEKKLKKSEVAKKLGITRQTLSSNIEQWKKGRNPNLNTVKKYLDVVGGDIKKFLKSL